MNDTQIFLEKFTPFVDDGLSISLNNLTIENASDKVSIRINGGIEDIALDKTGIAQSKKLLAQTEKHSDDTSLVIASVARSCLSTLEKQSKSLPDHIEITPTIELPGDPFSA